MLTNAAWTYATTQTPSRTPEFCYGQSTYPGCASPQAFWGKDFTIHGLWPQYSAGGFPADCTSEAFNTAVPDEIGMSTMTQYWPNVQQAEGSASYDSFWEHEWTKHGTCTGLPQLNYFNATITLAEKLGEAIKKYYISYFEIYKKKARSLTFLLIFSYNRHADSIHRCRGREYKCEWSKKLLWWPYVRVSSMYQLKVRCGCIYLLVASERHAWKPDCLCRWCP